MAPVLLTTSVGAGAAADTVTVRDGRTTVGPHDIVRVVVDNTGGRTGVTVSHSRARWSGAVRIAVDTAGGPAAEYVAVVHRGRAEMPVLRRTDGRSWRCADLTVRARYHSPETTMTAARGCLDGAPRMRVRVTAVDPGRPRDVATTAPVPRQSRPNVVMVMVDDMRADELAHMPATRRLLGRRGVTFANSFSQYPLCCPARASVLAGQYAHNHRVWSHKAPWGFSAFDDSSTLATWLEDAGYATVYVGKYLNGYGHRPRDGSGEADSLRYVPPGWTDWRASIDGGLPADHPQSGGTYRYFDTTLSNHGRGFVNYEGRYQTTVYGNLAEQVVRTRARSDQPFFFYLSFTAPHAGMPREPDDPRVINEADGSVAQMVSPAVPDSVRDSMDDVITHAPGATWADPDGGVDKPAFHRQREPLTEAELAAVLEATRQRAESLVMVDRQVERLVTALEGSGELDDTLVVFTSDNGYFLGEQNIPQGKILPYDPALRTPLLMRGPGIPSGEVRYDPFLSIDFAPTIAHFAGVRPGLQVDGLSMLPVARGGDRGWTRPVLTETGNWGVVRDTDESGEPLTGEGEPDTRFVLGVRTDRYLYTHIATGEEELYDLAVDPQQYTNLIGDPEYAATADLLRGQLKRVRGCDGEGCRVSLPAELATAPGESVVAPR